jgi:ADP-heptose:LPS heptosyltransferase
VDSGPLHLAAALDVPSVRLYGPVDPAVYGPWADPRRHRWVASRLLCAPCDRLDWDRLELPWHPCVRRLDPQAVLTEAEEVAAAYHPFPATMTNDDPPGGDA